MATNRINQVRPTSRFSSFIPQTEEQECAKRVLQTLADRLIEDPKYVAEEQYPFTHAGLIFLHGKPGRGKTHLLEAFVNEIGERAPILLPRILLSRNFFRDNVASYGYTGYPIILLDDLFSDVPSADMLHKADLERLRDVLFSLYEERSLMIVTCNFGLSSTLRQLISLVDATGRVLSRLDELISRKGTGEIELKGPDWRTLPAQQAQLPPGESFF